MVDDDFYGGYGAEVISVTEGESKKKRKREPNQLTPGRKTLSEKTIWKEDEAELL